MVDLSKAEPSRSFRNAYLSKYDRIIECVQKQRDEFVSYHDQCEIIRKERAAIIEEVVKMLKSLDIKPENPLGKYDNETLVEELTKLIKSHPEKNTEEIEISMIKIKNRFRDIENISRVLNDYARRIDNYPDENYKPNMEADYEDEIVITTDFKTVNEERKQEESEDLEQVVSSHDANEGLISSITSFFKGEDKEETTEYEVDYGDNEYATFALSANISLQDLVKHVYEENIEEDVDSNLWMSVYNFDTNKALLDSKADELGVSVDELAITPGMLAGVNLKFPTELVTYEETEEIEEPLRRAA